MQSTSALLAVALNGSRTAAEHPSIPRTPAELAAAARAAVAAGARIVHLHAYDPDGVESLAAEPCAAALRAVRAGLPISLTTSAGVEPDPRPRFVPVASWSVSARAVARGHGMRTGLEDTTVHADGRQAADNAELVRAAGAMMS